jgi:hypothetical protein
VGLCLVSIRLGTGEAEAVHPAAKVTDVSWVGVICLVRVRLGPEEAETVQTTTLEYGLMLCGNTSCKCPARSGKTEDLQQQLFYSRWVGGGHLCLIRPGQGEADTVQAAA